MVSGLWAASFTAAGCLAPSASAGASRSCCLFGVALFSLFTNMYRQARTLHMSKQFSSLGLEDADSSLVAASKSERFARMRRFKQWERGDERRCRQRCVTTLNNTNLITSLFFLLPCFNSYQIVYAYVVLPLFSILHFPLRSSSKCHGVDGGSSAKRHAWPTTTHNTR